jgi:tetratricopeptide (TPR) repeat protein
MTRESSFEVRLELARGHARLGEHEEAVRCAERALEEASADPRDPRLAALASHLAAELAGREGTEAREDLQGRLRRILQATGEVEEVPGRLATPTLAELLAEQGHSEQALRVAESVLRKRPDDPRARAVRERLQPAADARSLDPEATVAELERWLGRLRWRRPGREATA